MACSAGGSMSGCSAVNTDELTPNYFFNNYSNHPFDNGAWNFDTVWQANASNYPTLINSTNPVFTAFSDGTGGININEGQVITTNPYVIKVKPTDSNGITKVEFISTVP